MNNSEGENDKANSTLVHRLTNLYEISQCIVTSENMEMAIPRILEIAAAAFPISTAVVIETTKSVATTVIWPTSGHSEERLKRAVDHAHDVYSYLVNLTPSQISALQARPAAVFPLLGEIFQNRKKDAWGGDLLIFPLVIINRPVFGVLQLEGSCKLTEEDVKFANALANLFAMALDRHRRLESERQATAATALGLRADKREAQRANEAKSEFLANMSHEIRTPLGAILGFVNLLSDQGLSREEIARYLSIIARNAQHLLRVINDILDLAKVEAGKVVVEKIRFSLVDFLADFIQQMALNAHERGADFQFSAGSPLPEFVISDPTRIRQVLSNVVGNAVKFSGRSRVELSVTLRDHSLVFRVKDNGKGISESDRLRLFQPFSQGDESTNRKFGGTGLGLILARKLSQALGGDFDLIESEVGKGSTFESHISVGIPEGVRFLHAKDIAEAVRVDEPTDRQEIDLHGLEILLVEDSPDNQVLIQKMLDKTGADLALANDGIEGVQMALTRPFDVILMDIQMPRMDGHDAVRVLRARGYKGPIVALTAHAMKAEFDRAEKSGFSHFLTKPINRNSFYELLGKFPVRAKPPHVRPRGDPPNSNGHNRANPI